MPPGGLRCGPGHLGRGLGRLGSGNVRRLDVPDPPVAQLGDDGAVDVAPHLVRLAVDVVDALGQPLGGHLLHLLVVIFRLVDSSRP